MQIMAKESQVQIDPTTKVKQTSASRRRAIKTTRMCAEGHGTDNIDAR